MTEPPCMPGSQAATPAPKVMGPEGMPLLINSRPLHRRCALSGSADRTMRLWDLDNGACIATTEGHESAVTCFAVDWRSQCAISGSSDMTLKIWDLDRAMCIETLWTQRCSSMCGCQLG